MNGLPADIDLTFLVGRQLEQLRLGLTHAELVFDDNVSIDLEARFTLDGHAYDGPTDAHELHRLLGVRVVSAIRRGPGDLELRLAAHVLTLHDSNATFESYALRNGRDVTIV